MNKTIHKQLQIVKQASVLIAALSTEKKNDLLSLIVDNLKKNKQAILAANAGDVKNAVIQGHSSAFIDRLTLSEKGFDSMVNQLKTVIDQDDVVGEIIQQTELKNGILLKKIRFPLGVIAMIYESRPNVTIDVVGLCIKSGNAVILKGGSEAVKTNTWLIKCVHEALSYFHIPQETVTFLKYATHKDIEELLTRNDVIDVVIPRGSYGLTKMIASKSRIPILYHSSGGARMYIDKSADIQQALEICVNSKTNRTGVCNALDMVLLHQDIAKELLPRIDEALFVKGYEMRADTSALEYLEHAKKATNNDFSTEFLDTILAIKVVKDSQEALSFIQKHTNGHTEILAAQDRGVINSFIQHIDAAGLMINCSSRLHDGGEFDMGAEMGIATGKLHARGPVGIRELTTYKWVAFGDGQLKA